jgi:ATP synthase F1 delta subunit
MSFSKKIVTTYSKSLFQNTKDSKQDDYFNINKITSLETNSIIPDVHLIGEELLLIRSLILSSKTMKEFFKNPTYPEGQKLSVILGIFPGITISTKSFLKVLTERSHLSLIPEICDEYMEMLLKFKNSANVKLLIATGLKESYGDLLLKTLRTLTNCKEILLNVFYNPKLLGGLIIEYNSVSIDASILKEFSMFFSDI